MKIIIRFLPVNGLGGKHIYLARVEISSHIWSVSIYAFCINISPASMKSRLVYTIYILVLVLVLVFSNTGSITRGL